MNDHVSLKNVFKSFGDKDAVRIEEMRIKKNKITGFLGPNGAGKTTTIRMIMQIIFPDMGEIFYESSPIKREHLPKIGYLPEERGLFKKDKVKNTIEFFGSLREMDSAKLNSKIDYYLELFELQEYRNKKIEELSRGMQQKLQFIITILAEPELIILDEPFTGLDPINTEILKEIILKEKERGATIVFSTHMMEKVEQICEEIILINQGEIVLADQLQQIKKQYNENKIRLGFKGDSDFLNNNRLIESFEKKEDDFIVRLKTGEKADQILKQAMQNGEIDHFSYVEPTLSEIFLKTIKKGK